MSKTDDINSMLRDPDLTGAEVARRLKVSRQRVAQVARDSGSPLSSRRAPAAGGDAGRFEVISPGRHLACRITSDLKRSVEAAYAVEVARRPGLGKSEFLREALVDKVDAVMSEAAYPVDDETTT